MFEVNQPCLIWALYPMQMQIPVGICTFAKYLSLNANIFETQWTAHAQADLHCGRREGNKASRLCLAQPMTR